MSFTDQKRFVLTEEQNETKWGSNTGLYCEMCGCRINVGDGARWIYCNSDSPFYGNFFVCDECDGPDVKDRHNEAAKLIDDFLKIHHLNSWPIPAVCKLLKRIKKLERRNSDFSWIINQNRQGGI